MKSNCKSIFSILLLCILMLLTACGTTTITENDGPPAAVLEAQAWLGMHLGASVEEIRIVRHGAGGVDRFLFRTGRCGRNLCSRNYARLEGIL